MYTHIYTRPRTCEELCPAATAPAGGGCMRPDGQLSSPPAAVRSPRAAPPPPCRRSRHTAPRAPAASGPASSSPSSCSPSATST